MEKNFIKGDKVFNLYEEFKKFAFRGNVIGLAVGVTIANCFSKIVTSLVNNILMPFSSAFVPMDDTGYRSWVLNINGKEVPYGIFLGDVVTFLIISFVLFLVIRKLLVVVFDVDDVPVPTEDQKLLREIRDIMKGDMEKRPIRRSKKKK
jgi:large conductance mechanosensitive channel